MFPEFSFPTVTYGISKPSSTPRGAEIIAFLLLWNDQKILVGRAVPSACAREKQRPQHHSPANGKPTATAETLAAKVLRRRKTSWIVGRRGERGPRVRLLDFR